jgi:hypothetical protein
MSEELSIGEILYPSAELGTFGYVQVSAGIFQLLKLSDVDSLEYMGQTGNGPSPSMHEFKSSPDKQSLYLSQNQLHSLVKERPSA